MKGSAIVLTLAALAAGARADVTSRFDADAEGWRTATVPYPLSLDPSAYGTPDWVAGHIEATEFSTTPGDLFVLVAPTVYLGDKSTYYGGHVSYRLSDVNNSGTNYPNLLLRGNGVALAYVTPPPSATGTDYSISLTEAGWVTITGAQATQAQFKSALAGLDEFGINADWTLGGQDKVALDDVVLSTTPVPEPATLAALGLGLAALARRRR